MDNRQIKNMIRVFTERLEALEQKVNSIQAEPEEVKPPAPKPKAKKGRQKKEG